MKLRKPIKEHIKKHFKNFGASRKWIFQLFIFTQNIQYLSLWLQKGTKVLYFNFKPTFKVCFPKYVISLHFTIISAHVDLDLYNLFSVEFVCFQAFQILIHVYLKWHAIGIYTVYIVPPFVQISYPGLHMLNTYMLNASLSLLYFELLQPYCDFALWVYYVHKMVGLACGQIRRSSSLLYP